MRVDWIMFGAMALLSLLGVAVQTRLAGAVPGSSTVVPFGIGALAGLAAAGLCAGGRAGRALRAWGPWLAWGTAFVLMATLLVFGRRYRGGLYLPGRLNPSELVKLCLVVFAAGWMARGKKDEPSAKDVLICCGLVGVIGVEIALAGDFGLLAQLALTLSAMLFVASWKWGGAAFGVIGLGFVAVAAHPVGHLATRFAVWRDPLEDATGGGWQTLQGLVAVVSGGMAGTGFGMGEANAVPIVSSDFVYAALAEDLGLVGCSLILLTWGVIGLRGLLAAGRCAEGGERGEALLATGIVASLVVQVVLNVAGVINALPMTGITLPLISHGGSSLAVTLILCGILLGVSCHRSKQKVE